MPVLKSILPGLAAMRFRTYMASLDSELAQALLDRFRQLKRAVYLVLTDPRRLARTILARFERPQTVNVQQPVSVKPFARKAQVAISSMPIVFIHQSNSEHLKYSLAQAHASNPRSTIILLGDSSNDVYDFVEHRPFVEYFQEATRFQK